MSLLSGIRFIAKENRKQVNDDVVENGGKVLKDNKKHRKKKQKYHHKHKKNDHNIESVLNNQDMVKLVEEYDSNVSSDFLVKEDVTKISVENYKKQDTSRLKRVDESQLLFSRIICSVSGLNQNDSNHNEQESNQTVHEINSEIKKDVVVRDVFYEGFEDSPNKSNQSVAQALRKNLLNKKTTCKIKVDDQNLDKNYKTNDSIINSTKIESLIQDNIPKSCSDNSTIKELLFYEKHGGEDMDETYRKNILRLGSRYKGTEAQQSGVFGRGNSAGMDEENEIDMSLFKKNVVNTNKKRILNTTAEVYSSSSTTTNNNSKRNKNSCKYCDINFSNNKYMLSKSKYCYLIMKSSSDFSICKFHCEIIIIEHFNSIVSCDNEIISEIEKYKKNLFLIFHKYKLFPFFLESAFGFNDVTNSSHCHIDVIPIPYDLVEDAKMYFKEAFLSNGDEWDTHRLIPLSRQRSLKNAVPKQFQYLVVDWLPDRTSKESTTTGFVHVVGDTMKTSNGRRFCIDILKGLLEQAAEMSSDSEKNNDPNHGSYESFLADWEQFDWTRHTDLAR